MTVDTLLNGLSRRPDIATAELRAWDAADRYLLDTAAPLLSDRATEVVVIGDTHGALTLGALALGAQQVRVQTDSLVAERALQANAAELGESRFTLHPLDEVVTAASRLVLLRLPRALDHLDAIVREIARACPSDVVVLAGNMLKHMTPTQNDVLRESFEQVDVSLARGKARLLTAQRPRAVSSRPPTETRIDELDLTIVALAGVFAGASLDIGTRAMLEVADQWPAYERAIDLGCGTGVLATTLARREPGAHVIASDISAVAVASAALTAQANGVAIEAVRDDGLSLQPHGSADLIVLNPPFHVGAAVHTGVAERLFVEAARVLRPGGQLWAVWNSHLAHTPALERAVGSTRQASRTPKFTVTVSRKR
ncbi:class I SAM-dependent methyltransferase [Microcella sp.]|uniref:class I SAM-dependent methyltransferase n=1 Tax=Microcella sp. TaxID=1913979 RepID=UPI00256293AA|nr:class I SAM-dependent methyltransferase [Microcella sp.]MBX9472191.1 methyltransferase [Microcella sp.]